MREQEFEHAAPEGESLLEHSLVEQVSDQVKERVRKKAEEYRQQHVDEAKIASLADHLFTLVLEGQTEEQLEKELKDRSIALVRSTLGK